MKVGLFMTLPLCKNCIHYLPPSNDKFTSAFSECKKISTYDVVTGDVDYPLASSVRKDACGLDGKLYQPEPQLELKEAKHAIRRYAVFIVYALVYMSLFAYAFIGK
jgi:hypothetical protein